MTTIEAREKISNSLFMKRLIRDRWMYIMLIPGIVYFIIFKYIPMWGVLFAFQNYQPVLGFLGSQWVGVNHFVRFFASMNFSQLFRNTLVFAVLNLVFYFPLPIILALLLNELHSVYFKRIVQSLTYLPHFLSWVVIASITHSLLTTEGGAVNELLISMGYEAVPFLLSEAWLRPIVLIQIIWKECGWGTIIFLAALTGVDKNLYEAAMIDGAGHWKRMWHITLPAIRSTIIVLLVLRLGRFMDTGFEQLLLMTNSMNRSVGDVFDTYVYRTGIQNGQFSYSTAVGLFKSTIGLILIFLSNKVAKFIGEEGIF